MARHENTSAEGVNVKKLSVKGDLIVAGASGSKMYISTDRGKNWVIRESLPFDFGFISTLSIAHSSTLIASNFGEGIWVSRDFGATWESKNQGLNSLFISDIDVDPVSGKVFILTNRPYVQASEDFTWASIDENIPSDVGASCLAVNESNLVLVGESYLNYRESLIYSSRDKGANWDTISTRNVISANASFLTVATDTVFASGPNTGVYLGTASTEEFSFLKDGTGEVLIEKDKIYILLSNSAVAGIFDRKTKAYLSTLLPTNDFSFPQKITHTQDAFFISTFNSGVWKLTSDNNWEAFNNGLASLNTYDFIFDGNNLYVGTNDGLYYSGTEQAEWKKVITPVSSSSAIHTFLKEDNLIIAGSLINNKIYLSNDAGLTWKTIPQLDEFLTDIYWSNGLLYASSYSSIFFSKDKGQSWIKKDINLHAYSISIQSIAAIGQTVFLGTVENGILSLEDPFGLNKKDQVITFDVIPGKTIGNSAFNLVASSSSGLLVEFISGSDKIVIDGSKVTLNSPGRVIIKANQPGDSDYNAAPEVEQSFCINPATPTVTATGLNTENPILTSSVLSGNQWYVNNTLIEGATSATFSVTKQGIYFVKSMIDDCSSENSDPFNLVITGLEQFSHQIVAYPNPVDDELIVDLGQFSGKISIAVYDLLGRRKEALSSDGNEKLVINTSQYHR